MYRKPFVIVALGDSKSAPDTQTWGHTLAGRLATVTTNPYRAIEMGRGGYTVANGVANVTTSADGQFTASIIDDALTQCDKSSANRLEKCQQSLGTQQPSVIFIDFGANDVGFGPPWVVPNRTTWVNNYLAFVDAVHAQWPDPLIYISIPWKRQTGGDETIFDTLDTYIETDIIPARAFLRKGDDERVWFKNNADAYSNDRFATDINGNLTCAGCYVHFGTAAGQRAKVDAEMTVLGF